MAPARTEEDGFDIAIKQVPVTEQRLPFIQKKGDGRLTHAGEDFGNWMAKWGGNADGGDRNRKSKYCCYS